MLQHRSPLDVGVRHASTLTAATVVGEGCRPRWSRSVVPSYSVRNDAPLLEQRDDLVGERVQATRGDVRDEDEAVAGVGLHEVVDRVGDGGGVPTNVWRP